MADVTVGFATNRRFRRHGDTVRFGIDFHTGGPDELRYGDAKLAAPERTFTSPRDVSDWVSKRKPVTRLFPERPPSEAASTDDVVYGSQRLFERLQQLMRDKDRDTLVYVHGYNVDLEEALGTAYGLQWYLRTKVPTHHRPCNVVLFSWPSDGKMTPWTAYRSDRRDAQLTGAALGRMLLRLGQLLADVKDDRACHGRVHLLCHSMGNFVLQHAMQTMHDEHPHRLRRLFDQVFLVQADVDADALQEASKLGLLPNIARRVTVYHHRKDLALGLSDTTKGHPDRLGHHGPANMALLPAKVDVVDTTAVRDDAPKNHSTHLSNAVMQDVAATMQGEPRSDAGWDGVRGRWVLTP